MNGKGIASGARRVRIGSENDASSSVVAEVSETAKSITNPSRETLPDLKPAEDRLQLLANGFLWKVRALIQLALIDQLMRHVVLLVLLPHPAK